MFEVSCIFCRQTHRSEFWDEIEETLMRCRDDAPPKEQGLVEWYEHKENPTPVEVEAYRSVGPGVEGC